MRHSDSRSGRSRRSWECDVSDRGRGGKSDERDAATIFDASTNEANGREDENGVELCGWD